MKILILLGTALPDGIELLLHRGVFLLEIVIFAFQGNGPAIQRNNILLGGTTGEDGRQRRQ